MSSKGTGKQVLRARAGRNVIKGLVQQGYKINPKKASAFTQDQMEQKRLSRFAQVNRKK
jgi:hypothetical protein